MTDFFFERHIFEYMKAQTTRERQSYVVLLLFLKFSALVANPKKLLYTVANPARGLLNREKKKKKKVWQYVGLY